MRPYRQRTTHCWSRNTARHHGNINYYIFCTRWHPSYAVTTPKKFRLLRISLISLLLVPLERLRDRFRACCAKSDRYPDVPIAKL